MNCLPANNHCRGFTLVEVLAALMFMAIVIPVAIEGVQIASRAGQVGLRKATAARIADRVLNELLVTGRARGATAGGVAQEGMQDYSWQMKSELSPINAMRVVTVKVTFDVQGNDYSVSLSTLVGNSN